MSYIQALSQLHPVAQVVVPIVSVIGVVGLIFVLLRA